MKSRPIIFSGLMVRAILEGRKTQTRRVIKPQPIGADYWTLHQEDGLPDAFYPNTVQSRPAILHCPYGQPGDKLWVRETWAYVDGEIWYAADGIDRPRQDGVKLHPSIYMPHWASRITLEITSVRVARVRNITLTDAIAEGCDQPDWPRTITLPDGTRYDVFDALDAFPFVWDNLNAKRGYSWNANPWVWVLSFKVLPWNDELST